MTTELQFAVIKDELTAMVDDISRIRAPRHRAEEQDQQEHRGLPLL